VASTPPPPPRPLSTRSDDVTGALLVGGASRRFGSPKALARLDGETLAERAYRTLHEAFETVIAVGKAGDHLPLPFPIVDDGNDVRASSVGVAAALRAAPDDRVVVLPTDMPWIGVEVLHALADAVDGVDVAHVQTGPLPGCYRRSALAALERAIETDDLALHRALTRLRTRAVAAAPEALRNVNTPADLR
jgi:molybdopterin-guanine dinucleotide biosynthesis protein A